MNYRLPALLSIVLLAGCETTPDDSGAPPKKWVNDDYGPSQPIDVSHVKEPVPRKEPRSRYGNPESYEVRGITYKLLDRSEGFSENGIASWYGLKFHGERTSSGEAYDMYKMSAAHKTLPIPCYVRVTNLENGKQVIVRVNDRGPFHPNRIIDLSYTAAVRLDMQQKGTAPVKIEVVTGDEPAPPEIPGAADATGPAMYLQTGAFSTEQNAREHQQKLQGFTEWPIHIESAEINDRTLYRVQVGPIQTIDTLDKLAADLANKGFNNTHVKIR
ncbi:MAG: septal ring lytic transglycosylase RlpA family protein [bacterium]